MEAKLIACNTRTHASVGLLQPQDKQKHARKIFWFQRFEYRYQKMQLTEQQEKELEKLMKTKEFYYVDYHSAVEHIRYRLYSLFYQKAQPHVFSLCVECNERFEEEVFRQKEGRCPSCGGRMTITSGRSVGANKGEGNSRSEKFQRALRPLINLLNDVMKKSFVPFKEYSPDEDRLIQEYKREAEERKRASSGYIEEVVNVQETLNPCPSALDNTSGTVRNGDIPWLLPSTFFNQDGTKRSRKDDACGKGIAFSPASKRPRFTECAKQGEDNTVVTGWTDDDIDIIKDLQSFDRRMQEVLVKTEGPEEEDTTDTVSIRTGSVSTCDDQEVFSDLDGMSNITSPQEDQQKQPQDQMTTMLSQRALCGFDIDVLTQHVVTVGGELHPLNTLTSYDVSRMSDAEYEAYANTVAMIAGIS